MPRLRPEPRVAPNEPNGWVSPPALAAGAVTAGAAGAVVSATGAAGVPDVSGSVIVLFFVFWALTAGAGAARVGDAGGTR